jgi:hypothetical protein
MTNCSICNQKSKKVIMMVNTLAVNLDNRLEYYCPQCFIQELQLVQGVTK